MSEFIDDLARVLNKHSRENNSGTPDFILADYLLHALIAFETAISNREKWYGRQQDQFGMPEKPKGASEFTSVHAVIDDVRQLNSDERSELEALRRATHGMKVNTPIDAIMDEMRAETEEFVLAVTFGPFKTRQNAEKAISVLKEDHSHLFISGQIKAVEK